MAKDLAPKISDSELEVLRVLWRAGDALPVTEIRETLQKSRGWEATTVKTLISRLVTKGVLRQEKRQVYYYSPLISEEEYNDWATHDLISRVYHGSARDLVAALVRSDGLSQADIDELRALFRLEES
ncbi:MAG: BlaI/MecI/CopY family transcriptional regulator [Oscillospiraceae bacterium]|nr:BlaI/MecI/CopY family transcriptional regulator [Oscillospiraceae bacterium]